MSSFYRSLFAMVFAIISISINSIANAAAECGPDVAATTVTCDGDGVPASDIPTNTSGIFYTQPVTLNVDGTNTPITVTTNGNSVGGINVTSITPNQPVEINLIGDVTVNRTYTGGGGSLQGSLIGYYSGAPAYRDSTITLGPSVVINDTTTSAGGQHYSVSTRVDNAAVLVDSDAQISTILTGGGVQYSAAMIAADFTGGANSKVAIQTSGPIDINIENTTGGIGWGVFTGVTGAGSADAVELNSSSTITANATGLTLMKMIEVLNYGDGGININSSGLIKSNGNFGGTNSLDNLGVSGISTSVGSGNVSIEVSGGIDLNAQGYTVGVQTQGTLATVDVNANISSNGTSPNSTGIHILADNAYKNAFGAPDDSSDFYEINVTDSYSVTGTGYGILAEAALGGTINLAPNSLVSNTALSSTGSAIKTTVGNDVVNLNGSVVGLIELGDANDSFNGLDGGVLQGRLEMGDGSDETMIRGGFNLNDVITLDGGDDTTATDGFIDTLTFNSPESAISIAAEKLLNWEIINVAPYTSLNLAGSNLNTGTGTDSSANPLGINIDTNATLMFADSSFTINGDVNNSGILNLRGIAEAGNTLTINGDYSGIDGNLLFDTKLAETMSTNDTIIVNGDTNGNHHVYINNVSDISPFTPEAIKLIQIAGSSNATFKLAAPVQAGSWEYFLNQHGNDFYLESDYGNGTTSTSAGIYRPAVAAYTLAQKDNFELAFNTMSTLHQREGDHHLINNADNDDSAWGRWGGAALNSDGKKQFNSKQRYSFVQIGKDIVTSVDSNDAKKITGIMASFANSNNRLYNQDRRRASLDTYTGNLHSTQYSIGAYHTKYGRNERYLDLVGQVSVFKNNFDDIYNVNSTQRGRGLGLSAEVGKPIKLTFSQLQIEPQFQLSYQRNQYKGFSDSISTIDAFNTDSLRARIGQRLSLNIEPALLKINDNKKMAQSSHSNLYMTINLLADLIKPEVVVIGGTEVSEQLSDKPWLEIGTGGQVSLGKSAYLLYGTLNYQRTLIASAQREGIAGNIGIKVPW